MKEERCILTTKDFTILEVMYDRCREEGNPLAPILKRKLDTADIVFRDDIGGDVATLSSRVTYRLDDGEAQTRVLSHDHLVSTAGVFLSIMTVHGLALMGLSEGQSYPLPGKDGGRITLDSVHFQPEAARRAQLAAERRQIAMQAGEALAPEKRLPRRHA